MNDYCKDCVYAYIAGVGKQKYICCTYILHRGRRRPCPAGEGCTEHSKRGGACDMRATDIDLDLAKKLWAEGKTDIQVSEAVGVPLGTLRAYKRKLGLTAPRAKKEFKPDITPQEPVIVPPRCGTRGPASRIERRGDIPTRRISRPGIRTTILPHYHYPARRGC